MEVGFIGLGAMGMGMATHALKNKFSVHGFDIDPEKLRQFETAGGKTGSLEEKLPGLDVVLSMLVNSAQAEQLFFGEKALAAKMKPGSIYISGSTVSPDDARKLAGKFAAYKVRYIDSPVSGGTIRAAQGDLVFMVAGKKQDIEDARPLLDVLARNVFIAGEEIGQGSVIKIVNQLLAGSHIVCAAEALVFAMKQGLSAQTTFDIIKESAGNSWIWENRMPHVLDGDYTPLSAIEIFVKDLGLVTDTAHKLRYSVPMAAAALEQFIAAAGSGLGKEDDSAVAKIYARNSGVKLPEKKSS